MKNSIKTIMAALLVSGIAAGSMFASDTATQNVTFTVSSINDITVSGPPAAMTVTAGTAGGAPTSASDTSSSYAITTNESNRKITAQIDEDMPSNVALRVTLAAPTGATSAGAVTLSSAPADVVTGISNLNESGKGITYGLSATSAAAPVTSASRTVTLTVTAGA
jgi:hypothetical protein